MQEDLEFLPHCISIKSYLLSSGVLLRTALVRRSARSGRIRQPRTLPRIRCCALADGLSEAKKSLKSSLILQAESHLHSLVLQGQAIQVIVDCIPKSGIEQWSRVVEALPDFLFRFVKKALQQQLPTASNLARWKRIPSPDCMLCKKSIHQTDKHLLSNCESLLECYSERHNKILERIARWIDSNKSPDQCLAVDLPFSTFLHTDSVFKQTIRPDIVLYDKSSISVLELTVCHETNLLKSREFKLNKYKDANNHLQGCFSSTPVQIFTAEISVLGIASDLKPFCDSTNLPKIPLNTIAQLSKDAITCSFEIYKKRTNYIVHSD